MTATSSHRLLSLDAFRGITIAAMILVNDPGSSDDAYAQLKHAQWNGWTATDLVFPFFLVIVGVASVFSLARRSGSAASAGSTRALLVHIVRRALILFALGLFVNGFPFWLDLNFSISTWRIPGVLQRIALCYLAVSLLIIIRTSVGAQSAIALALLLLYALALRVIPVPGWGAGVLEPVGNLCWYIDSHLLAGHTWAYAPAPGFDPEGILSTLPAIATTIIGAVTGHWLRAEGASEKKKAAVMAAAGALLALSGSILGLWLPINKNLWTSSYVLLTGGLALVALSALYWLIDLRHVSKPFTPFIIFGMNAIAVYTAAELLWTTLWSVHWRDASGAVVTLQEFLYATCSAAWNAGGEGSAATASLAFAALYTLLMFALAWTLWRKHWFVKI